MKRMRPPIVGVPALAWCSCGPSSRICWPNSRSRRNSMNFGPRKIVISIAAMPAIRICPRSTAEDARAQNRHAGPAPPVRHEASVTSSRPTAREPLTRTASPASTIASASGAPPRRPRPRRRARSRGRARRPRGSARRRAAGVGADLAVVALGVLARARASRRGPRRGGRLASRDARCSSAARIEMGLAL